jgi:hypothetical protein
VTQVPQQARTAESGELIVLLRKQGTLSRAALAQIIDHQVWMERRKMNLEYLKVAMAFAVIAGVIAAGIVLLFKGKIEEGTIVLGIDFFGSGALFLGVRGIGVREKRKGEDGSGAVAV